MKVFRGGISTESSEEQQPCKYL